MLVCFSAFVRVVISRHATPHCMTLLLWSPVRSNQPSRSFSHSQQPLLAMQPGPLPAVQRLAPANPAGARRLLV
ncbi:hypothetical protein PAPYR_7026 [Paratrimastix pyriformis]|uniref:Secreted protein n=1 Tax=Paratrimastix pyriformis TaxID=342808 RepID=A0ABQ8UIA0_9EUKA|nr:hypothetical protein PAPYR_7026 [Paratrimastix pyriformis]